MIEIIGDEGSPEYSAAEAIAESIAKLWPGIKNSPKGQDHILIAANVKLSGYRVSDIDIVMCGVLKRDRRFIPKGTVHDRKGKRLVRKPITVDNFLIAVEVKDHEEHSVKVTGDSISVIYSRGPSSGWKNATDQNVNQVHALRGYVHDIGHDAYVHRCLYMRGLASLNIGGGIASGFDGVDFFTAIAALSRVSESVKGYVLSSGGNDQLLGVMNAPIFKPITPTALDRKRMDKIVENTPESDHVFENLGQKMVVLRGHGGTGKTIMLLQAARKAFEHQGFRSLVLTYNHALAADIRRLLALLRIPSNPEEGGISVQTVMSFMYAWFNKLQYLDDEDDFSYENYDRHCDAILELLREGAISNEDITSVIQANPDRFDHDCIIVDEAQDWPQGEVDLLKRLYYPNNICLADGIDQLLRGKRPDWERGLGQGEKEIIPLTRCLRMKRNLAVFTNEVADIGEVRWQVTPNDQAGGGRVILLTKPYKDCDGLHDALLKDTKDKGNAELDFLFCVPPSSIEQQGQHKQSDIGHSLSSRGYEVWDGVDDIVRKDFPRSQNQFRIVQYASCRGLEGWTVVLHNADHYWEVCKSGRLAEGLTPDEEAAFEDSENIAERYAWHRLLIALTRPIDTLVIGLDNQESRFSIAMLAAATKHSEFVEIVR